MAEPYADIAEHVADELRRAWLRVEYQIRLGWTKGQPTHVGEDAIIGPDDMGRIFAAARGETPVASDEADAVDHQRPDRDLGAELGVVSGAADLDLLAGVGLRAGHVGDVLGDVGVGLGHARS